MPVTPRLPCRIAAAAVGAAVIATSAWAGPFDDLTVRWDNTVTLSTEYGLHNALPSAANYCALNPH